MGTRKVILVSSMLCSVAFCANAQLRVKSDGKVLVGDQTSTTINPQSTLSIGDIPNCNSLTALCIGSMTKATGIDISLNATSVSTSSVIGISANPAMSGTSSVSVIGVYGNPNGMNTKVYGVVGVINNGISGAGVYAGLTAPTSFSGRYAAYMYGNSIVTNGTLTATVVTPSDIRLKQNMQLLPAKTTTAKLLQLQPIEYNLKPIEIPADSVNKQGETIKYTVKQYNEETPFFTQKRYGFVAQEVQKVLPDVVYEGSDGYLGIDYTALVPLLVQTVQEQQKQIEQQQTQIEYLMSVIGNKNQLAEAQKNDTTK